MVYHVHLEGQAGCGDRRRQQLCSPLWLRGVVRQLSLFALHAAFPLLTKARSTWDTYRRLFCLLKPSQVCAIPAPAPLPLVLLQSISAGDVHRSGVGFMMKPNCRNFCRYPLHSNFTHHSATHAALGQLFICPWRAWRLSCSTWPPSTETSDSRSRTPTNAQRAFNLFESIDWLVVGHQTEGSPPEGPGPY